MSTARPANQGAFADMAATLADLDDPLARENRRLRQDSRDALLVVAILVRKLGGEAVITEEEMITAEPCTIVRAPEGCGWRLTVREDDLHGR